MGNEWLEKLKPGDKVICRQTGMMAGDLILGVEKVTKTQIGLQNGMRVKKGSGRVIGLPVWSTVSVEEATPARLAEARESIRRAKLIRLCRETKWRDLDTGTLESVVGVLNKTKGESK